MELHYEGKTSIEDILNYTPQQQLHCTRKLHRTASKLIYADNMDAISILRQEFTGKVDLIYIDPPYATNQIFRMSEGRANTISRSTDDAVAYSDELTGEEYIKFLRKRLVLLKELLSDQGSIYLHIDYKIGHYVKILMDEIFGSENFINDITRIKCNPKNFSRNAYGNIKDMILFYSKTGNHIWNDIREPLTKTDIKRLFAKMDEHGRRYTTIPLHAPGETKNGDTGKMWRGLLPPKGRHWRSAPDELEKLAEQGLIEWSKTGNPRRIIYADEHKGKKIQDILTYKDSQNPSYPTEKKLELLELIVQNSSHANSIVLDCFAGSGNTLIAAQKHNRRWIGIDASADAFQIAKNRIEKITNQFEIYITK